MKVHTTKAKREFLARESICQSQAWEEILQPDCIKSAYSSASPLKHVQLPGWRGLRWTLRRAGEPISPQTAKLTVASKGYCMQIRKAMERKQWASACCAVMKTWVQSPRTYRELQAPATPLRAKGGNKGRHGASWQAPLARSVQDASL